MEGAYIRALLALTSLSSSFFPFAILLNCFLPFRDDEAGHSPVSSYIPRNRVTYGFGVAVGVEVGAASVGTGVY